MGHQEERCSNERELARVETMQRGIQIDHGSHAFGEVEVSHPTGLRLAQSAFA